MPGRLPCTTENITLISVYSSRRAAVLPPRSSALHGLTCDHCIRGNLRLCNAAIPALRLRVECAVAWEDKFKRQRLRFEHIQQRHYGMKVRAYTLINLRAFYSA
jgi:hypothetical protein